MGLCRSEYEGGLDNQGTGMREKVETKEHRCDERKSQEQKEIRM